MAIKTKYTFPNASGANGQSTTVFANHGIELNNQDDLDVYVYLSTTGRVLQYRQSTGSTTDSNHPQVNDTTGLYFPSVSTGVTLYNYTLSTDFNTITFSSAVPTGGIVSVERRTRDSSSNYTNFTSGGSIRSTELNSAFDESNFTAQEARNKAFDLENRLLYSNYTPYKDDTIDLGSSTHQWKDLWIDGTAHLDAVDINDGTIDGTAIGGGSPAAGTFTTLTVNGNTTLGDANTDLIVVNGKFNTSLLPNGSHKGLGAAGNTWHWAHIHDLYTYGGTTLGSDSSDTITVKGAADFDHTLNVDGVSTLATVDINGGYIDGTPIGVNTASSGAFTTVTTSSNATVTGVLTAGDFQLSGSGKVASDLIPNVHANYDLGAVNIRWGNAYVNTANITSLSGPCIVDSGTSTSNSEVYSAKRAGEIFYEKGTLDDITSGDTWVGDDNKLATTGAIDARIIDLVDDVGGFVPIANETSFPNANPDVNNGAGTIVSIGSLASNLTSNGSGVISISNGTVGNSTVTINGAANSTTYSAGYGMLVETTSTLNTYTFHRLSSKATEVTTVAGNIANINTVAGISSNVTTVAGISSNVTTVAGDTTAINNITTNLTAVQNAATNATNAASSATSAATSATTATTQATTATTQATNAASSATSAASSATTATTQASSASTSEANALAYKNLALTYRNDANGILTQVDSAPYNLSDSASTHTAWGNITDTGANAVFSNETSNILLTMSEGSSTYNYGSIT